MAATSLEFQQLKGIYEGGVTISEPVLGADKQSLFFVLTAPSQVPRLYESKWNAGNGSWGYPTLFTNVELVSADNGTGGGRRVLRAMAARCFSSTR